MPVPQFITVFDIPNELRSGMKQTAESVRRHIIRQALRSALLPSRNYLKAQIMGLRSSSRQSTGATYRSITSKYKNARNNPDRFYGIIGVNRKLIEAMTPEKSQIRNSPHRQISFGIKTKRRNDDGSPIFSRKYPRQEVRSYYRRRVTRLRKRQPSKYLHLIEFGFSATDSKGPWKGKRTRSFPGHRFIQKAQQATEAEARAIFEQKIREHFLRLFQ